jgi:tRNA pseudouridine38-40 synthase
VSWRVRIDLEYDGSGFSGWQLQPGRATVQGALEQALSTLFAGRAIRVHGAGRTDAGVHATGQVAHVSLPDARHSPERLRHSLNALTPDALVVHSVTAVAATFDARRSACWRAYRYRLSTRPRACGRQYVWFLPGPLSFRLLQRCAEALPGSHSFTSFCVATSAGRGTQCRILEARWRRRGSEWHFDIRGNRFVHGMVRSLVGTMVRVAEGRLTVEDFGLLLSHPARGRCAPPAPAHGLTLVRVAYAGEAQPALDS